MEIKDRECSPNRINEHSILLRLIPPRLTLAAAQNILKISCKVYILYANMMFMDKMD